MPTAREISLERQRRLALEQEAARRRAPRPWEAPTPSGRDVFDLGQRLSEEEVGRNRQQLEGQIEDFVRGNISSLGEALRPDLSGVSMPSMPSLPRPSTPNIPSLPSMSSRPWAKGPPIRDVFDMGQRLSDEEVGKNRQRLEDRAGSAISGVVDRVRQHPFVGQVLDTPIAIKAGASNPDPRVIFDVPAVARAAVDEGKKSVQRALRGLNNPVGVANMAISSIFEPSRVVGPKLGFGKFPEPAAAPGARPAEVARAQPWYGSKKMEWAKSFRDPSYDQAEVEAARQLGLGPEYVAAVKAIRTVGERTNAGVRSSAGANTPYQFTPGTRDLFRNKYKIDPWADPVSGAKSAMLHLKESRDKGLGWKEAAGEYIGGPDRSGWKGATNSYMDRVMAALPNITNPFMEGKPYFEQARAEANKGFEAALQPQEFTTTLPEGPAFPDEPVAIPRDYTETDKLLETLRPVMIGEQQIKKQRRASLFAGLAQGLSSIPEGAGLGTVLAGIGAGMLAGRAAGMEKEQAMIDKFDEKMAAFNVVAFKYGADKAETLHADAANHANQLFQYNMLKFQHNNAEYNKYNNATINGNYWQVMSKQPDGTIKTKLIPLEGAIRMQQGLTNASISQAMATGAQAGAGIEAHMQAQIGVSMANAAFAYSQDGTSGEEGHLASSYLLAGEVIDMGAGPRVFSEADYQEEFDSARAQALAEHADPKDLSERINTIVKMRLSEAIRKNPKVGTAIQTIMPDIIAYREAKRLERMKRTERTDYRGRRTVTEQEEY